MTDGQFTERAVCVPFAEHGRSYLGFDCWGLVVCYYRDVLGIELPSYGLYDSVKDHRAIANNFREAISTRKWLNVEIPEDGHVAVIYRRGLPLHAGVAICRGSRILHCEQRVGTIHEPLSRFRIEGFYRLASQVVK